MWHDKNKVICLFSDVQFSPQLIAIVQELVSRKVEVDIILIGHPESKIAEQIRGHKWKLQVIRPRKKIASLLNFFLISFKIIKIRPYTLFSSGLFATCLGMISGQVFLVPKRIFVRHHSNLHHKYNLRLGLILDHLCNRLSTHIVAVSGVVSEILNQVELVSKDKISLIYNGVSMKEFKHLQRVSNISNTFESEPKEIFRVGVISRLTEWKGVKYTAEAFAKLYLENPNTHLHIVGAHSDSFLSVTAKLKGLPEKSHTIESIVNDVPEFFSRLDAFVHVPIGRNDEAFGIVYIEALASGVNCIFTESGVITELSGPEDYAFMVPYMNSEEIYQSLKEISSDKVTLKRAIPESWLGQFSLEIMAKRYGDLLVKGEKWLEN